MNEKTFANKLRELGCDIALGKSLKVDRLPREGFSEASEARKWFEKLCTAGATGWAQFSAVNVRVTDGKAAPEPEGILLAAELYVGSKDESHHLRHDGEKWIATVIAAGNGDGQVLEKRKLIQSNADQPLCYEVAWSGSPLRPVAFRLVATKK